ncbi:hypothetical protein EDB80DRAFT_675474 [Ilyonectria destructans]|nr:hypothetical protein EDB80DRAFT_675474 [Ilyonectria destructans]
MGWSHAVSAYQNAIAELRPRPPRPPWPMLPRAPTRTCRGCHHWGIGFLGATRPGDLHSVTALAGGFTIEGWQMAKGSTGGGAQGVTQWAVLLAEPRAIPSPNTTLSAPPSLPTPRTQGCRGPGPAAAPTVWRYPGRTRTRTGSASGCKHAGRTHGPRRRMEEVDDPAKCNSYRVVRVFVYFDAIFGGVGVGDDAAADDAAPVETL